MNHAVWNTEQKQDAEVDGMLLPWRATVRTSSVGFTVQTDSASDVAAEKHDADADVDADAAGVESTACGSGFIFTGGEFGLTASQLTSNKHNKHW